MWQSSRSDDKVAITIVAHWGSHAETRVPPEVLDEDELRNAATERGGYTAMAPRYNNQPLSLPQVLVLTYKYHDSHMCFLLVFRDH